MSTVQSIERAVAVLAEVADKPGRLTDLADRVDLPVSTAGRLLATLEDAKTVTRQDDGAYRIGPAIIEMARSEPTSLAPIELVTFGELTAMAHESGEAVGLCIPTGDMIHCVAQFDAPKPVQAEDWTGRSWPLHLGGSGIVTLATRTDDELEDHLARCDDIDVDAVRARVRQAAVEGLCWSHGDYEDGLSSVAAAVVDAAGRAMATVYLYGPSYRFPGDDAATRRYERLVLDVARRLSGQAAGGTTSTSSTDSRAAAERGGSDR